MRAVLVGPAPPFRGGIAGHTAGACAALRAAGHEVEVLSYSRLYPAFAFPGTRQTGPGARLGEPVIDVLSPSSWIALRRRLLALRPDLVIAQWWHPVSAGALALGLRGLAPAKVVVVCHNLTPHERFPGSAALARCCLARADLVVCHCEAERRRVAGLLPAVATASVPMPILTGGRAPSRMEGRAALGIEPCTPLAVFVGHLRAYKGLSVLVDAWRGADLPEGARLVIAGESYLARKALAALLDRISGDDSIFFRNKYLSDYELKCYLACCDVLVLPYLAASQSGLTPLAEALGTPMIASSAGGLAELGRLPGARCVAPGDAAALAAALEAALRSPRASTPAAVGPGTAAASEPVSLDVERSWRPFVEVVTESLRPSQCSQRGSQRSQ